MQAMQFPGTRFLFLRKAGAIAVANPGVAEAFVSGGLRSRDDAVQNERVHAPALPVGHHAGKDQDGPAIAPPMRQEMERR